MRGVTKQVILDTQLKGKTKKSLGDKRLSYLNRAQLLIVQHGD